MTQQTMRQVFHPELPSSGPVDDIEFERTALSSDGKREVYCGTLSEIGERVAADQVDHAENNRSPRRRSGWGPDNRYVLHEMEKDIAKLHKAAVEFDF
jgi:hypothetical protein